MVDFMAAAAAEASLPLSLSPFLSLSLASLASSSLTGFFLCVLLASFFLSLSPS